ncbi:Crp/Fnr family transcriptional regulator [Methylobacterium sp. JK268]
MRYDARDVRHIRGTGADAMDLHPEHVLRPLLRNLELHGPLSEEDRRALLGLPLRVQAVPVRRDVVAEGSRPAQCCIVLSGWLYRYRMLRGGRRQIFAFHVPGDMPDLHSLFLPVMDHAIATLTPASLAFVPHAAVRDLVATRPNLAAALWRETVIDAAVFRAWMVGLGRQSATAQLAHMICEIYRKLEAIGLAAQYRYEFPPTQAELADALGLTTVHVNRTMQELKGAGLIRWQDRTLEILDWEAMAARAEFNPAYLHLPEREAAGR